MQALGVPDRLLPLYRLIPSLVTVTVVWEWLTPLPTPWPLSRLDPFPQELDQVVCQVLAELG